MEIDLRRQDLLGNTVRKGEAAEVLGEPSYHVGHCFSSVAFAKGLVCAGKHLLGQVGWLVYAVTSASFETAAVPWKGRIDPFPEIWSIPMWFTP